jgi:lipocalin
MKLFRALFSLFFTTSACVRAFNPVTVPELDVDKYTGRWYQVLQAPTNTIFQGEGTCLTADYGLNANGTVSVLNAQVDKNGNLEEISGYAYYKNASEAGKLTVYLQGTPFDGPYWVVKLGEEKNMEYQYSIITVPSQISLWVIVRNVNDYTKYYETEITNYLNAQKYHYETVVQNSNCKYVS